MEKSAASAPARRRETNRKRLLREALELTHKGRPVLLDELRWTVMGAQLAEISDEDARRSLLNSFARTVRDQLPDHAIEKIRISAWTPMGLLARAAVYRIKDADALHRFLCATDPCILCRYRTNLEVEEPRYKSWSRYVIPRHHAAIFRFFECHPSRITDDQLKSAPGTFIPATQSLTLIVPRGATTDMQLLANVPWKLYGCDDFSEGHEMKGTEPLKRVHRNEYIEF